MKTENRSHPSNEHGDLKLKSCINANTIECLNQKGQMLKNTNYQITQGKIECLNKET